jgi:hypothetical protein
VSCSRPLDGIDIEALAADTEPLVAPDAAEHALRCPECGRAVEAERRLTRELEEGPGPDVPGALAARVLRLRPFSSRERTSLSLWGPPVLFAGVVFAGGAIVLAPGLAAGEQAGLFFSALASAAAVARAAWRAAADLASTAPAGLTALSEAFRAERAVGLAALALLLPAGLGLRRALARARARR